MKLLDLRKHNKLTQHEVAKILNITQPSYNAYEKNESQPNIETLKKTFKILQC